MKSLRKLAGITIALILIFMVIAIFRYQAGDEVSLLPEGFELFFNENWTMAVLDGGGASAGGGRKAMKVFWNGPGRRWKRKAGAWNCLMKEGAVLRIL